jgi:hypothetical protein
MKGHPQHRAYLDDCRGNIVNDQTDMMVSYPCLEPSRICAYLPPTGMIKSSTIIRSVVAWGYPMVTQETTLDDLAAALFGGDQAA